MRRQDLTPTFSWNESSDADLYDEIAYTLDYGIDPSNLTNQISTFEEVETGYSLYFDGSDAIQMGSKIYPDVDFGILSRVYIQESDGNRMIFDEGGNLQLRLHSEGTIIFTARLGSGWNTVSIPNNF